MPPPTRESQLNAAFVRLAQTLVSDYDLGDLLQSLVDESARILELQAGGLMLADGEGVLRLVASTSHEAELVDVLQLAVGDGPAVESFASGAAIGLPDIRRSSTWPDFGRAAAASGFRSVHVTPLRLHDRTVGVMTLFGVGASTISAADIAVAQALADVAAVGIVTERAVRDGRVAVEQLQSALDSRVVIEQAKGLLAGRSGITLEAAFTELRTRARNRNSTLRDVARAEVAAAAVPTPSHRPRV